MRQMRLYSPAPRFWLEKDTAAWWKAFIPTYTKPSRFPAAEDPAITVAPKALMED